MGNHQVPHDSAYKDQRKFPGQDLIPKLPKGWKMTDGLTFPMYLNLGQSNKFIKNYGELHQFIKQACKTYAKTQEENPSTN